MMYHKEIGDMEGKALKSIPSEAGWAWPMLDGSYCILDL